MGKFKPLNEYLDAEWDDPEKRKELREAVFERIAALEADIKKYDYQLNQEIDDHIAAVKRGRKLQARLDAVAALPAKWRSKWTNHSVGLFVHKCADELEQALEQE